MQPVQTPTPYAGASQPGQPNVIVVGSPVVSPAQVFPERYGLAPLGILPPPIYPYPPPPFGYRPYGYPYSPYPYGYPIY